MSQSETINNPSIEAARQSATALEGKIVCPFCGAVGTSAESACNRCTMQNTPATRQATKARIGPWYVLQIRNPSAPGMKFATLQALIKKGQVTARSIVRGPTTYQLWRFAAHIKGISREFGLCYGCSARIETTANICPQCQRLQEPPINPDVLLETRPPQVTKATVHREIRPVSESDIIIPTGIERKLPESPAAAVDYPDPAPAEDEFSSTPLTSEHLSPPRPPTPKSTGQEILTPKELAAVFQLNLPAQDKPAVPPRKFRRRRLAAAAVLMILLLGAAYLVYDQSARHSALAWVEQTYLDIRQMLAPSKVIAQPDEPASASVPVAPPAPKTETPRPLTPAPTEPKAEPPAPQPAPSPAPMAESPSPEPEPTQVESTDPDEMIQQARILWRNAISAEANGDYALAVRYYEQIKKLPPIAWPGGLDLRLESARKHLRH